MREPVFTALIEPREDWGEMLHLAQSLVGAEIALFPPIDPADYAAIQQACGQILALCPVESKAEAEALYGVGMPLFVVPGHAVSDEELIAFIRDVDAPAFLLCEGADENALRLAKSELQKDGGAVTLFYGPGDGKNSAKDANVRGVVTVKGRYQCSVGYIDATGSMEAPVVAGVLGAEIIALPVGLTGAVGTHSGAGFAGVVHAVKNALKTLGDGKI